MNSSTFYTPFIIATLLVFGFLAATIFSQVMKGKKELKENQLELSRAIMLGISKRVYFLIFFILWLTFWGSGVWLGTPKPSQVSEECLFAESNLWGDSYGLGADPPVSDYSPDFEKICFERELMRDYREKFYDQNFPLIGISLFLVCIFGVILDFVYLKVRKNGHLI